MGKNNKFFFPTDKTDIQIQAKKGLFVAVINTEAKSAFGALYEDWTLGAEDLAEFFKEVNTHFKEKTHLEFKLVGLKNLIDLFAKELKKQGYQVEKEIERKLGFELFFNPAMARIRLAKEMGMTKQADYEITRKVKILIVDDSPTMRNLLTKIFQSDPNLQVVGQVERPSLVAEFLEKTKPDVVTLDIQMPEMDGVTLLKKLIPSYPLPYIMVSALSIHEGPLVLDALASGAVDYIQKPSLSELATLTPLIVERIKAAASANIKASLSSNGEHQIKKGDVHFSSQLNQKTLIAIGSSTGGTEALRSILIRLPSKIPPILITQHIPPVFSKSFADRLNQLCPFEVKEAEDGDLIQANRVLIAPGATQMTVAKGGGKVIVDPNAALCNRHKPSVDILFDSVAKEFSKWAIGIILTGMGNDGAKGLLNMKNAGGRTLAQNKESCVVFGMPREAIALGAAEKIVDLHDIPEELAILLGGKSIAA